jgi:hypothetical protein
VNKAKPAATKKPPAKTGERASQRRGELEGLKAEIAQSAETPSGAGGDAVTRWLNAQQENDVRAFVASKAKQLDRRKYQLSLVKEFIDDPSRFGLDPGDIPTSTSLKEFAERRSELEYRIALMRTFLEILTEELRVLDQAEAYTRKTGGGTKN